MIGFFPTPYEDELCYSIFARYYLRSGYATYTAAAEDIYSNPKCHPNIDLFNAVTPEVLQFIRIEDLIINHSVFPYYHAFLTPEKQAVVWEMARTMDIKKLANALPFIKSEESRFLRYCPLCAQEDRAIYSETYWHRAHQLHGIQACFKHASKLLNSHIEITSKSSPALFSAEETIGCADIRMHLASDIEIHLAQYAFQILKSYTRSHSSIDIYYKNYLAHTPYLSPRGAKRDVATLTRDFNRYYTKTDVQGFSEQWQIEKLLYGKRTNPFENILMGLFLNIPPQELVLRKTTSVISTEEFDKQIVALKQQGLNYRQISTQLGMSYDYCKSLGEGRAGNKPARKPHSKGGRKGYNWENLDRETLPRVKEIITYIERNNARPQKITYGLIARLLHLSDGQINKMPLCKAHINKHIVCYEEHFAKTVEWAIAELKRQGNDINISNIQHSTNLKPHHLKSALPYLSRYVKDQDVITLITNYCYTSNIREPRDR